MSRDILAMVLILLGAGISAANADYGLYDFESPRAKIDNPRWQYSDFGRNINFDANNFSYNSDNDRQIISWLWEISKWNGCGYTRQNAYLIGENPKCKFPETGIYCLRLWVQDYKGIWCSYYDTDCCYVATFDVNFSMARYIPVGSAVQVTVNITPSLKDLYYSGAGGKFALQLRDDPNDSYETTGGFYISPESEEYFTFRTWDISVWNDYKELEYLIRNGLYIKSAEPGVMQIRFGFGKSR